MTADFIAIAGPAAAPLRLANGRRSIFGHLLRHRAAQIGLVVLVALLFAMACAPLLATHDPLAPSLSDRLKPPSANNWLGTDGLGRDIYSRMLYGSRYSVPVGLLATLGAVLVGGPLGLLSGFYAHTRRDWMDTLIMRIMDIMLAFPGFLLALMLVSALGPGLENAMIAVALVSIPIYARLARASVITIKNREFVTAARAYGAPDGLLMLRHVVPNAVQPLIVQSTLGVAFAILTAAGLSFLGLGARPPAPEWGAMLNDGRGVLETAPWVTGFPGLAVAITVLGVNLLGDGLRDVLDPRIRKR